MLDQAQRLREMVNNEKGAVSPRIITVTSGKGGVGKSNFVVNLAISLQKLGKKVLIFDADMGMANDDVLMGFLPKYNIFDIIFKEKSLEEVLVEGPYGVKLLPGGTALSKVDGMTEGERQIFLEKIKKLKGVDYIIIDTGAGINRDVLGFIACSDDLVLVITPEPTSLTDSYSLLKAVNYFKVKSSASIVVNRIIDEKEGKITFEKLRSTVSYFLKIDIKLLGFIAEDRKLIKSVRSQMPIVIGYPNSLAAMDIKNIAGKVIGYKSNKNSCNNVEKFFNKLFNIFS